MASPNSPENQIYIPPLLAQAIKRQPDELNPLQPTNFKFVLYRTPETIYFCQKSNLPGISLGVAEFATPLGVHIPLPGSKFEFDDFEITFLVNEDMGNWLELSEWLRGLAPVADNTGQLKEEEKYSNGSLILNNSNHQPVIVIDFNRMFPTRLSSIEFDSTLDMPEALSATVSFAYTHYDIKKIS